MCCKLFFTGLYPTLVTVALFVFHVACATIILYLFIKIQFQPNHDPVYADLARTKGKNKSIPPAPKDTTVVYSELMAEEQADIIRQQLGQKPPPYEDVQMSSTSFPTSVTVIPPGIHGDSNVTTFTVEEGHLLSKQVVERTQNVEDTFENQNSHLITTPEGNQNDITQI